MLKKILRILTFPFVVLRDVCAMFVVYLPGRTGVIVRRLYYKRRLKFLGNNARIDIGVYFQHPEYITVDDNVWIDRNVIILAGPPTSERITYFKANPDFEGDTGEVYIGESTHIAPNCVLSGIGGLYVGKNCGIASNSTVYSFSHHYRNLTDEKDQWQYSFTPLARRDQQSMILGPVVIEEFCAIGLNSTILPGSTLKRGTWISCGSIILGKYSQQTLVCSNSFESKQKSLSHLKIRE